MVLLLALGACRDPGVGPARPEPTTPVPTETHDTASTDPDPTTPGETSSTEVVDCSALPEHPLSAALVAGAYAHKDVLFDDLGNLIGSDENALLKFSAMDGLSVLAPGAGLVNGLEWLPDGDIVAAASNGLGLLRISPAGVVSVLTPDVSAFGLAVASNGTIFAASYVQGVLGVDPATGIYWTVTSSPDITAKVVALDHDETHLYIGTAGEGGSVWVVALGPDLAPLGPATLFADEIGENVQDTLGIDACGNLYIADLGPRILWRVRPDGTRERFYDPWDTHYYAHGLEWGRGVGGWDERTLYIAQPYNGDSVTALDIGVPSSRWTGAVVGLETGQ
jgi:hypothetical protein